MQPETKMEVSLQQEMDSMLRQISQVPGLYERNNKLCRTNEATQEVIDITREELDIWLTENFNFTKQDGRGVVTIIGEVPLRIVRECLALLPKYVPHIETIYEHAIIAPDYGCIDQTGYNETLESYIFNEGGITWEGIDTSPESIEQAKSLIFDDLLYDFRFKDDASRSNYLAYLLTFPLRPVIDGNVPLLAISSPAACTGKSTLMQIAHMIWQNKMPVDQVQYGSRVFDNNRKAYKTLCAVLQESPASLIFDNITRPFYTSYFAILLTDRVFEDRLRATSEIFTINFRTITAMAGNNLSFLNEMRRRVYWCRLIERDGGSEFKHNLHDWVRANRTALMNALYVLIKSWIEQGRPQSDIFFASFQEWSNTIGGVLENADIPSFLEKQEDEETVIMKKFCEVIYNEVGEDHFMVNDVIDLVLASDKIPDNWLGEKSERSKKIQLTKHLGRHNNTDIGDYHLTVFSDQFSRMYRIVKRPADNQ